jgi:hypothetical protein
VVAICTQYAQKGMFIHLPHGVLLDSGVRLSRASFFIGYLISIALFGSSRRSSWRTPVARGTTPRKSSRSS